MEMDIEMKDFGDPDDTMDIDNTIDTAETEFADINEEVTVRNEKGESFIIGGDREKLLRRGQKVKFTGDFLLNVLELDNLYADDTPFINYLLDSGTFTIERNLSDNKIPLVFDYTVNLYSGRFESIGGVLTEEETGILRDGIMDIYDDYVKDKYKEMLRKAGIVGAIGISIVALVTGLSVGLRRKGNDLKYKSKRWKKLKPSKTVKDIVDWTDLTDASGSALVFTGKYLTVTLIIVAMYLIFKVKRTVR